MTARHSARGVNGRFVSTKNAPADTESDFPTYDDLPVRMTGTIQTELAYHLEPRPSVVRDEPLYPHLRARRAKLIDAETGQHLGDVIIHPDARAEQKKELHRAAAGDDRVIRNLVS